MQQVSLNADLCRAQRPAITSSSYFDGARKPPPPPPEPEPSPSCDPRDADEIERERVRFAKQRKMLRVLAALRGIIRVDGVDHLRFYEIAAELGRDAALTRFEYLLLKVALGYFPSAWPSGFSRDQAKAIRDEINLPRQAERKAERRTAMRAEKANRMRTVADLDCRSSAVHTMLDVDRWKTALQLSKMGPLKHSPAFQPLAGPSLKKAIRRVLDKLVASDRAETKQERSKNGPQMDLFRRR